MCWRRLQLQTHLSLVAPLLSQNAIHNHIRLFEPRHKSTEAVHDHEFSVQLQKQVLALLAQLVQLRVNYCLLDSDLRCGTRNPDLPHPLLLQ